MKKIKGISSVKSWEKPSAKNRKKQIIAEGKIREAFKNESGVTVIPPHEKEEGVKGRKKRVAAYCRVSTDEESQTSSYELQINYYREHISRQPNWEFAGIYADRGLSGTAMKKRDGLLKLISDCKDGKVDHIITKSVSRFSRNVRDCLVIIDELLNLNPPVEVDFEVEGLNSAKDRFESQLFFSSYLAQNESVKKSAVIKWAWQIRFSKGLALMPTHSILGYDKDRDGRIVIVPKEAKVIRFIYNSYLAGMAKGEIAKALTDAGIPTVTGLARWSTGAVHSILSSEKYVGDALMQKTYTPDCLSHKAVKNNGHIPQYYKRNHHDAIISRQDWGEVQRQLISRRFERVKKLGAKTVRFKSIRYGKLKGFYVIPIRHGEKIRKEFINTIYEGENNNEL